MNESVRESEKIGSVRESEGVREGVRERESVSVNERVRGNERGRVRGSEWEGVSERRSERE